MHRTTQGLGVTTQRDAAPSGDGGRLPDVAAPPALQQETLANTELPAEQHAKSMAQGRQLIPWTVELSDADLAAIAREVARIICRAGTHPSDVAERNLT